MQNIPKWRFPWTLPGSPHFPPPSYTEDDTDHLVKTTHLSTHTRLCKGNTNRNTVSLAGFRKEKLALNTSTLSRFQKQRLPSTAPSPPSYTPLLPKADLLLMKSLPQDGLECDGMRKGRERRKRRGRSKR